MPEERTRRKRQGTLKKMPAILGKLKARLQKN